MLHDLISHCYVVAMQLQMHTKQSQIAPQNACNSILMIMIVVNPHVNFKSQRHTDAQVSGNVIVSRLRWRSWL